MSACHDCNDINCETLGCGKELQRTRQRTEGNMTPKIFLGTPMYGGQCYGHYAQSVFKLQLALNERQWGLNYSFMFNESLINRARNAIARLFLKGDSTHLLFIDADICFEAQDIAAMIEADVDVICGLYPKKEINWQSVAGAMQRNVPIEQLKNHTGSFVVNLMGGASSITIPQNKPFEIMAGGTGCMLIKRHVFEKLAEVTPTYTNDVLDLSGNLTNEKIHNFFNVSICPESNRLLSEDYHFCIEWQKIGGKVHAAPWAKLSHIGTYPFEGALIPDAPR